MTSFAAGRYYDATTGRAVLVPYANPKRRGEFKNPTIADARKFGLYPSVTTILGILDKPALDSWKVDWAVQEAITAPYIDGETADQRRERIVRQAEDYATEAREMGEEVHRGIAAVLRGHDALFKYREVPTILDNFWRFYKHQNFVCEEAEHVVLCKRYGFGGTLDFLGTWNGVRCIADFKTQNTKNREISYREPEWPMQLAAYALALGEPDIALLSVVISRDEDKVDLKWWRDTENPKSNRRWRRSFLRTRVLWSDLKRYEPAE